MARRYSAVCANGTNTAALNASLVCLTATAAIRVVVKELLIGSRATADNAAGYLFARHITTAPAGGTAITPSAHDNGDPAAVAVARTGAQGSTLSTAPTLGASILQFGLHQRAPFRWLSDPGYEPMSPAGANDGFSWTTNAVTTAFAVDATVVYEE